MIKSQLDNLISFCSLFSVESDIIKTSPDYILEKWDIYIGLTPREKFPNDYIFTLFKNEHTEYKKNWGNKYQNVKDILNFIILLNRTNLTPSSLVDLFNNNIGDSNSINKDVRGGLHEVLNNYIKEWKDRHIRDYNLTILT